MKSYISPETYHEWLTWHRSLYNFLLYLHIDGSAAQLATAARELGTLRDDLAAVDHHEGAITLIANAVITQPGQEDINVQAQFINQNGQWQLQKSFACALNASRVLPGLSLLAATASAAVSAACCRSSSACAQH